MSISITSLGEERANLSAFRTFVRFMLVWFCLFLLPLGVWEGRAAACDCGFPWIFLLLFFKKKTLLYILLACRLFCSLAGRVLNRIFGLSFL